VIVELNHQQPVVVPATQEITSVVISNGYHLSRELELRFEHNKTYLYQVTCTIDDARLVTGILLSLLLFGLYILIGLIGLIIAANLPILYMLGVFYLDKRNFIQITAIATV
jgi:hypothetical protein